jgi:DNA-binding GntR family transcriptional regulator
LPQDRGSSCRTSRKAKNAARASGLDTEFHLLLCRCSGLTQMVQLIQNRFDRGEYCRIIMHARRGGFAKEALNELQDILRAVEAGDIRWAAQAIEHHRLQSMQRLRETT